MDWLLYIYFVAATGGIALILWNVDATRSALAAQTSKGAEAKALQLLLANLTARQRQQYLSFGYFDVVGSATGKRYRIWHGTFRNVNELLGENQLGPGRCFMPRGDLAAGDCMLAQKIALENCEQEALQTALRF